jgi:hypothetical protein
MPHTFRPAVRRLLRRLPTRSALAAGALAVLAACAGNTGGVATGPLPQFAEYEGREVRRVEFEGDLVVPADSLRSVVTTRPSRCRIVGLLPFCVGNFGKDDYNLDLGVLSRDVARIQLAHREPDAAQLVQTVRRLRAGLRSLHRDPQRRG